MRSMLAHAYGWRVNALDAEIPLTPDDRSDRVAQ